MHWKWKEKIFQTLKNKKGFTVIEMVLAVAIVALLANAAIGYTTRFSDNARVEKIMIDSEAYDKAIKNYLKDKNYYKEFRTKDKGIDYEDTNFNVVKMPKISTLIEKGYISFVPLGIEDKEWNGDGSIEGENGCKFEYKFIYYRDPHYKVQKYLYTTDRHILVSGCRDMEKAGVTYISGKRKGVSTSGHKLKYT